LQRLPSPEPFRKHAFAVRWNDIFRTLKISLDAYRGGARTLIATALQALIAQAIARSSLSAEEGSAVLGRLEAELVRALETVRRARGS
jgi:hypothetical protein